MSFEEIVWEWALSMPVDVVDNKGVFVLGLKLRSGRVYRTDLNLLYNKNILRYIDKIIKASDRYRAGGLMLYLLSFQGRVIGKFTGC